MKHLKHISILFIAVLALLLLLTPKADAATVASGTCGANGGNLTWTLDDQGTLTISGTGAMTDWTSSSNVPWYSNRSSIKKVTIGGGVTTIGEDAFVYCTGLTSVTIPDSVTTIGNRTFYNCTSLNTVTIGNSVTTIGEWAFYNCTGLTSVTIPNSVTTIGDDAFCNCTGLTTVTIPDSVTTIGDSAFYYCTNLTSVTIPDSVTTIGDSAFYYCTNLTSVTIPDSVTTIGDYAFCYCYGLTSVTIPDSVTTIGNSAFYRCTSLTGIWVDDQNKQYSSDQFGVLFNKEKTTMIQAPGKIVGTYTIPDSVTTIGNDAFRSCKSLTSVTIPDSVTTIGSYAFYNCTGLKSVTIPDSVTAIGSSVFYNTAWYNNQPNGLVYAGKVAYEYKGTCPASVTIKAGTLGIAEYAFSYCDGLTSVIIPDSVTTIGSSAFEDCTGLTSVTIPDSVTTIGRGAFCYCTGLKSVTIGNSVTTIGGSAFWNCTGLKTVIYCGTSTQWNSISIGYSNSPLTSATRYYHNWVEASCTAPKTCTICGTTEGDPEHNFYNWTQITKPTCTTEGVKSSVCALCGETETVAIPATGHSGSWIDLVPASCTTDGIHARVCATCNTMVTENVPAFGHSYTSVVTAPTCTTQGYTTKACATCGDVEITNYVSAKGHSWNPWLTVKAATCAAEGTQMRFCNCGTTESQAIEKLPHSYTDGVCTACGTEEPVEVVKFDIDVARMILGNALQFQFGVDKAKIPDTTGYYAVIEKTWADGAVTTKNIPASDWGTVDKYYAIVYQGMAAKEMADTFYVTIYNADGVAVSNAKQDSVRDYVARAYKSQNALGKTMVIDMLNYGAAAQVYFTYNTEDLANNQLTDEQKASGTAETPAMENKVVKGENYTASRFILSSSIQVQVGFKGLTKDMYAVYTYVDYRGLSRQYRIEGKDFVVVEGKLVGVELSKLVYADARCMVNVTVYNAGGTVYGTATDSIESCAYRSNDDLFVTLMKFADSARAKLSA